jgi:hypothetical protein
MGDFGFKIPADPARGDLIYALQPVAGEFVLI